MDALLEDMLRTARDLLVSVYGDLWEADINWDGPVTKFDVPNGLQQSRVSHAKGFIAGCAAMANTTPLTLLDQIRDMTPEVERELAVETAKLEGNVIDAFETNPPPCLRGMGCLCAGHARGNAASDPCDTTEVRIVPFPAMTTQRDLARVQGFNRQPKSAAGKRQRIRRIKK